jgi:L-rhamnose mutarotase
METKRYCLVIELKEEKVKDYCDIHRNPWPEILDSIKEAGAKELIIWNYNNLSIVYYECEDLDDLYKKLGKLDITASPYTSLSVLVNFSRISSACSISRD